MEMFKSKNEMTEKEVVNELGKMQITVFQSTILTTVKSINYSRTGLTLAPEKRNIFGLIDARRRYVSALLLKQNHEYFFLAKLVSLGIQLVIMDIFL